MGHRPGTTSDRSDARAHHPLRGRVPAGSRRETSGRGDPSRRRPSGSGAGGSAPATSSRRAEITALVTGVVLGAVLAGGGTLLATQDAPASAGPDAAVADQVAELEQREADNAVTAVGDLVADTEAAYETLLPVLSQMAEVMPATDAGGAATPDGAPARAATVQDWLTTTAEVRADLEPTESAGTDVNIARQGLTEAVRLLEQSARTLLDGGDATSAGGSRDSAVRVWAIAATQLDELAIAADGGHVHLYLPLDGAEVPMAPNHDE